MLLLAFLLLFTMIASKAFGADSNVEQYMNPEWTEPHAWAAEKDPVQRMCPQTQCDTECDKHDLEVAFRKLVHNFFDRSKFTWDESSKYMYRSIHIHATEEQLEKLHTLSKPDNIDGLLEEILSQSDFGMTQLIKEYTMDISSTIANHFSFNFDIPPRTKQISINFALLVIVYIICRRLRINFVVVIVFSVAYFLYEYLDYECHKRIAAEEAVSFIYGREKNPCEESKNQGWLSFFLYKNQRAECHDYMIKQNREGKQCGVIDLFQEFIQHILLKQIKTFFMTLADLIHSINTTYSLVATVITMFFMKDILKMMIYSTFKFILNPTSWSSYFHAAQISTNEMPRSQTTHTTGPDIRDINMGKALDLASSRIQLMLTETVSAAIKTSSPVPSLQSTSSTSEQKLLIPSQHSEPNDLPLSSNPARTVARLDSEASGVEQLSDDNIKALTDNTAGPASELESYEEITYDELIFDAATDVKSQTPLGDDIIVMDDCKSSKSSSSSDIKLLKNVDCDSDSLSIENLK